MNITLGTTYYNNPEFLKKFIDRNLNFVDEIIIVDDGSRLPVTDFLKPNSKIRLFKVKKDYGFNSHGCRNLIMKMASNPWVILMDIDREFMFPEEDFKCIKSTKLKENILYRFVAHHGISSIHKSVNDVLVHKDHFFKAGGYDEELIGVRTGDRQFFRQLQHFGEEKILYGVNMRLTRNPSVSLKGETRQLAKSDLDKSFTPELQRLITRRINKPEPDKPILTFEWEEITS